MLYTELNPWTRHFYSLLNHLSQYTWKCQDNVVYQASRGYLITNIPGSKTMVFLLLISNFQMHYKCIYPFFLLYLKTN